MSPTIPQTISRQISTPLNTIQSVNERLEAERRVTGKDGHLPGLTPVKHRELPRLIEDPLFFNRPPHPGASTTKNSTHDGSSFSSTVPANAW